MASRRRRLRARVALCVPAVVVALAAPLLGIPAASQAVPIGLPILITPDMDLAERLAELEPGDTAYLMPGVYPVGLSTPDLRPGTGKAPITVTAFDPDDRPLIRGSIEFEGADHWVLDRLRFQAGVPHREALRMFGGRGWTVQRSEIFGASVTGAFANAAIANSCFNAAVVGCRPREWRFVNNCVHTAGRATRPRHTILTDHNLYITASGRSPGLVSRNLFFGAPFGADIKIGRGEWKRHREAGASGIVVRYNTLHGSRRGIVLEGRVLTTDIRHNLIVGGAAPREGTLVNSSVRKVPRGARPNVLTNNLYYGVPLFRGFSPVKLGRYARPDSYRVHGNRVTRRDPAFTGTSCSTYVPREAQASRYGRFSSFFGGGL